MINTVTLNPAMDEILYIESFQENCMNRIQKKKKCLGGKGTHLAYNFHFLAFRTVRSVFPLEAVGRK